MRLKTNTPHICLLCCAFYNQPSLVPCVAGCIWTATRTLLFDLSNLSHGLLEDCAFVRLDIEAVDVGEVGRDELSQLFNVLALLFPPTLVTPARAPKGLDM